MASKYLKNEEIKPNHIYVDSKGFEVVYLGKATQKDMYWSYPLAYIYIKKKSLDKYPKGMPLRDILNALQLKGVRCYCFSTNPRKMVAEIGVINQSEIHGKTGIFDFE